MVGKEKMLPLPRQEPVVSWQAKHIWGDRRQPVQPSHTLNQNAITMHSHFDQWFEWPLSEAPDE